MGDEQQPLKSRPRSQREPTAETGTKPTQSTPDNVIYPSLPRPGAPLFGRSGMVSRPHTPQDISESLQLPSMPSKAQSATTGDPVAPSPLFPPIARASRPWLPTDEPTAPFSLPQKITLPPMPAVNVPPVKPIRKPKISRDKITGTLIRYRIPIAALLVFAVLIGTARPLLNAFAAPHHGTSSNSKNPPVTVLPIPTGIPKIYAPIPLNVDHPAPELWAESAFLLDESNGTVLFGKNPLEQLPMASTTKLMTAVVVLSHAKPNSIITITPEAETIDGTRMVLNRGEKYTVQELMYGMLMLSGNDAAYALAIGVAGNMETFVKWMNETAVALGLTNTHYTNPHGLDDDGHYSCARDLAVLARYALSLDAIHTITNTRTYTEPATATHPAHSFENQHQILWWYPGADGGKTGWTGGARFVDILSSERNGHHLLGVIMHGQHNWVTDMRNLMNWGFNDFTWISPHDINLNEYIPFADSYDHFSWDQPDGFVQNGDRRYYTLTGFTISGSFLKYFDAQNGLPTFGFPINMPIPDGTGQIMQKFQKSTITCDPVSGNCQTVSN